MIIIDQLIDQARQEENERREAAEKLEAMEREEKFHKLQRIAMGIATILGPGWDILKPFMEETYQDNGFVNYELSEIRAESLSLRPFKVFSNGNGVHFFNDQTGERIVHDQKEFARMLMFFRSGFPEWQTTRQKRAEIERLSRIYEYCLIAWSKEYDRILAANRVVIEAAQKDIPSFEIYDLEYSVFGEENEGKWNTWVLDHFPDRDSVGEEFYLEIDRNGNINKKKFFYPICVNIEAVVIEPRWDSGFCRRRNLIGGQLYYGPNIDIEDYLPIVFDLPEKPIAPEGLPGWNRVQIETKILNQQNG